MEITFYRTLANKLADAVIQNQEYSEAEEKRIRYGLVCIFSDLYKFILTLVVFSCFLLTKECLISFIPILLLRPFLAGYHAKSELMCIFMSFATLAISILVGNMNIIPPMFQVLAILILPVTGILIAPVRTQKVQENIKKIIESKILTAVLTILLLIFDNYFLANQIIFLSVSIIYILALYQLAKNFITNNA
ncbi:accessory gene regulator B [Ruminiclostridium sufflavum DSM 19573]|uniref:Accessory gene regulator B n=1 Tax=Ruminiclostridium sufflavum DSM 19573 TaxID=1121337 RepID=A0A318XGE1_9FIRM|nr:accessory gene regulator B family protein [Ruminiclostridium sufflavum]PYG85007.1 accessory gene regulator B [Ruminiclostridium sufflavum DSM 19573]